MEVKKILRRTPSKIFCPLCGQWHKWEGGTLKSHDEENPYKYLCECEGGVEINIWHEDGYICIESSDLCSRINDMIYGKVFMNLSEDKNQIELVTCIIADNPINSRECCDECCNLCLLGDKHNWDDVDELELKFILKLKEE